MHSFYALSSLSFERCSLEKAFVERRHSLDLNLETIHEKLFQKSHSLGFPGGAVVENPPANAGDTGSSPGLGGSHMPRSN